MVFGPRFRWLLYIPDIGIGPLKVSTATGPDCRIYDHGGSLKKEYWPSKFKLISVHNSVVDRLFKLHHDGHFHDIKLHGLDGLEDSKFQHARISSINCEYGSNIVDVDLEITYDNFIFEPTTLWTIDVRW